MIKIPLDPRSRTLCAPRAVAFRSMCHRLLLSTTRNNAHRGHVGLMAAISHRAHRSNGAVDRNVHRALRAGRRAKR